MNKKLHYFGFLKRSIKLAASSSNPIEEMKKYDEFDNTPPGYWLREIIRIQVKEELTNAPKFEILRYIKENR